jgi:formylglycine-generating enzyme required for sulfatase activity
MAVSGTVLLYAGDKEVKTELLKGAREVLPFFALRGEKGSRPAADLKKRDITLLVNGRNVRDFSLLKKSFNSSYPEDGRRIYLFFDTYSLPGEALDQARWLAGYIIRTTHHSIPFGILVTDPARGVISPGPLSPDKKKLLNWLNRRLTPGPKPFNPTRMVNAFRELQRNIYGDNGTKLLYIFTGQRAAGADFINRSSPLLGESGALTVFIEPAAPGDHLAAGNNGSYPASLAKACSGTYIRGNREQLVKRLDTLHRSYYETVFPFLKEFGGGGQIALGSAGADVRLHSPHYLRKNKPLADIRMKQKELLALGLLQANDWNHLQLQSLNLDVLKNHKKQTAPAYRITLPSEFIKDEIEFYRLTFNSRADEILMDHDTVIAGTVHLEIDRGKEHYFVLLNPRRRAALVIANENADKNKQANNTGGNDVQLSGPELKTVGRTISRLRDRLQTLEKEDKLILVRTAKTRKPGLAEASKKKPERPTLKSAGSPAPGKTTAGKAQTIKKLAAAGFDLKDTDAKYYYELAVKYLRQDRVGHALHYLRKAPAENDFVKKLIHRLSVLDRATAGMEMILDVFVEQSRSKAVKKVLEAAPASNSGGNTYVPGKTSKIKRLLGTFETLLDTPRKQVKRVSKMLEELPKNLGARPDILTQWRSSGTPFAVEDRLSFNRKRAETLKNLLPELERYVFIESGRIEKILNQLQHLLDRHDLLMQKIKQRLAEIKKSRPEMVTDFVIAHGDVFAREYRVPYFKKKLERLGAAPALLKESSFFDVIIRARGVFRNRKRHWEGVFGDGIRMVYIPGGEFTMGVPWESGGAQDESPQHKVYLDSYWLAKYETTFEQYDRFCDDTGRGVMSDFGRGRKKRPVVGVSWKDARAYCQWLSERTGLSFRLPTEAEWEKAARGVKKYKYPWGDQGPGAGYANLADLKFLKKYRELNPPVNENEERSLKQWIAKSISDGYVYTAPVGKFPDGSSPYGVMDMAGNVWEWVYDWYDDDYYHRSPKRNPVKDFGGTYKVARGGGWDCHPWLLRSTGRAGCHPERGNDTLGFRVALAPVTEAKNEETSD